MTAGLLTPGRPGGPARRIRARRIRAQRLRAQRIRIRRIAALARAEALLLLRSPMALLNAVLGPIAVVALLRFSLPAELSSGHHLGPMIVASMTGFALLLAVYYNLVTVLVARREELVLKRLRTGQAGDVEILAGAAVPAIVVAWCQSLVALVAALTGFDMSGPVNPVLLVVGLVLGTAVFVVLAAASTVLTPSVELAQVTTMPVLLPPLFLSGLFLPLTDFPDPLRWVARMLPLTPVVDLLHLGLTGATNGTNVGFGQSFVSAVPAVLTLTSWLAIGGWVTRRWMRWEPRR